MASVKFGLKDKEPKVDNWRFRRLFMLWQTLFCKIVIGYVLFKEVETKAAVVSIEFAFMLLGVIILAYVFGATMEDINKVKLRK